MPAGRHEPRRTGDVTGVGNGLPPHSKAKPHACPVERRRIEQADVRIRRRLGSEVDGKRRAIAEGVELERRPALPCCTSAGVAPVPTNTNSTLTITTTPGTNPLVAGSYADTLHPPHHAGYKLLQSRLDKAQMPAPIQTVLAVTVLTVGADGSATGPIAG